MTQAQAQYSRLEAERDSLLGLIKETEGLSCAVPRYEGMGVDPTSASIEATLKRIASIETKMAGIDCSSH